MTWKRITCPLKLPRKQQTDHRAMLVTEKMNGAMECVLAWLAPRDVAAMAFTCSAMASAARALSSHRVADAAQGMEPWPVPVVNSVDECRYPYFEYSPVCVAARKSKRGFAWGSCLNRAASGNATWDFVDFCAGGCSCRKCDSSGAPESEDKRMTDSQNSHSDSALETKPTLKRRSCSSCPCGRTILGDPAYDSESKLLCLRQQKEDGVGADGAEVMEEGLPLIYECGVACSCTLACIHRRSQRGLSVNVKVVRDAKKGWSLHAAQEIKIGSFVCEYAGELLTTKEAQNRQRAYDLARSRNQGQGSSLLVLREHLPSGQACLRVNIDATDVGNLARFINHSCDGGNLFPCLIRSAGSCFPRLGFFARKHIIEGEELTFSYGNVEEGRDSEQPCFCGTQDCLGVLPSEKT